MADVKPLSTKDLFLLMVGWNRLKKPPSKADKAENYWLDNGSLRDSEWNWEWPFSPKDAWESVRYRDWLMANIAANLTDSNQDFIAISEPLFVSLDLLPSEIKPRIPFTARVRHFVPEISTTVQRPWEPDELETDFQTPVVEVHKREMALDSKWEKFGDWKSFVKDVCERVEGRELLNAPIGPLLLEKVSDSSGIKDIIKKREKLEEEKEEVIKDLDEAVNLLKGLWDWKAPGDKPDSDNITPSSSQRKLGHMLESLGLLNSKPIEGGYFDYSLSDLAGLTVWEVVNRLHDELDGFPLYVKGQDPKDDNGMRGALTFASQAVLTNPRKHYFGLAGLAYNIPLETAGKNIQVQEDQGEKKEEGDEESTVEIKLHLGKWFDGETLDDNWFRRLLPSAETSEGNVWKQRVPLPGIRLLPFQREQKDDKKQAKYSLALRADLRRAHGHYGCVVCGGLATRTAAGAGIACLLEGAAPLCRTSPQRRRFCPADRNFS
jgi:hypothetical protein